MSNETTCSVPGCKATALHSLPLKRDKAGQWQITPICEACRKALVREVRAAKQEIRIYGLESSVREAQQRNARAFAFRPFLAAFAKPRGKDKPPAGKNGGEAQPRLRAVKG